jgi:hypothetical protein
VFLDFFGLIQQFSRIRDSALRPKSLSLLENLIPPATRLEMQGKQVRDFG